MQTVKLAIENRKLLSFVYEGYFKIVEPYCYGISFRGKHCLRAFQVDGESSTGKLGWKLYDLSKAQNIMLLEEAFLHIRAEYKRGDSQMAKIFLEL